ncbi:hypothetical protein [Luteimonas granuli]|uniref:hypothetical protein n=1 Tax=Luteimonas granuli TaxID=1176533 RepID=UPI001FE5C90C|nr:hypothetical protein [Luteimonas granuli]
MREQDVGSGARVAPDIGVDAPAIELQPVFLRLSGRGLDSALARTGSWRAEQVAGAFEGPLGADHAAKAEQEAEQGQSSIETNGRAIF